MCKFGMKRNLTLLVLFFFFISMGYSQNRVRVYGYVTNKAGEGVEFANVVQKGTSNATMTASSGFYDFYVNPQDSLIILYSYMSEVLTRIITDKSKSVQLNVILSQEIELKGAEVRGIQIQTSSLQTINPNDTRLIPSTEGIEDLLATTAGVRGTGLSYQYSVRGGSYDENIVYVNDIEIYRPLLIRSGQQEGLSFINPDMVEKVAFSAGGFDARYGDKMSSVLDIKYKKPTSFEASISVSLLGASAYVGTSSKKFTQIHGFRYKTSRYLLGTLDEKGEYNPNFLDYQTYLTYDFSSKWEITFLGNFSQNNYEFIPKSRSTSFGTMDEVKSFKVYFDGQEKDMFRTLFGALTLNYKPLQNLTLSIMTSAFHTNEEETYDITGEYWLSEVDGTGKDGSTLGVGSYHEHARNELQASVLGISHLGDWKKKGHNVKWGISAQEEMINDKVKEWEMRDSAGYSITYPYTRYDNDRQQVDLYYNLSGHQKLNTYRFQGFLQDTYKFNWDVGTLAATAGIRANYWTFNDEFLLSPRVSLGYIPTWKNNFVFRFATGLYYQAPFYKELRYTVEDAEGNNTVELNKDIKAQKTYHFVLATDYYFRSWGRPFKLTAEGYYKLGSRFTPYTVDNLQIIYLSKQVSKGYTTGLDLKLFGEMVPGTDSWIGVSLMRSREDVKGDSYEDSNGNTVYPGYIPRPNEQRYGFTMFFQDYFPNNPKYKVHLKFVWEDGLPFGPPSTDRYSATFRTPPYRRVDIGASRILVNGEDKLISKKAFNHVKNIWLTLEILNLLNTKNVSSYYWVTDVNNHQYAVPNYLTTRQINLKLAIDFK